MITAVQKFWHGGYSLPIAFWVWYYLGIGVGVSLVYCGTLWQLPDMAGLTIASAVASVCVGIGAVGVWRSADSYQGPKFWSVLARVAAVGYAIVIWIQLISLAGWTPEMQERFFAELRFSADLIFDPEAARSNALTSTTASPPPPNRAP